ncbi:MAG: Fungal specific transcription factor [Claussenomyces sp. TS43310]|nr:MAG: Fungal specific transcription factor [Claussenomyces sp. TS43310]
MNPRSPTSVTSGYPSKRARHSPSSVTSPSSTFNQTLNSLTNPSPPGEALEPVLGGKAGQSSSFRNRLPSCASCDKANVNYVFYLESRVNYLETLLQSNGISYASADALNLTSQPALDPNNVDQTPTEEVPTYDGYEGSAPGASNAPSAQQQAINRKEEEYIKRRDESDKLNKLVSNIGMVSVQGASDPRYLGSTSGISFARVVFAAVKSSVSGTGSDKSGVRPSNPLSIKATGTGGTSMRDSFFGLQTKPTIKQAPFPDRELGLRLITIYFEFANPQIPVLHRGEFMKMVDEVYSDPARPKTPRELYMMNIVFAIGGGIFLGQPDEDSDSVHSGDGFKRPTPKSPNTKRIKTAGQQYQPEEYHASAIVHLEACLSQAPSAERLDGFGGGLEELQAVLLLAGFALLRPVAPGLWYIVGVAVRLAVDLGLHYEDGKDIDVGLEELKATEQEGQAQSDGGGSRYESSFRERGRRQWIRDVRRRLWWCTYSFDRLVSTCVGRPFGITDQVITTEFPSLLDDKYITREGFLQPSGPSEPTYKNVAHHYFRLRLLQSEILQVLQHQQAQLVRAGGTNQRNAYMHTQLPSPFLVKFGSFRSWRIDIDRRLWEWKESAPTKRETGVQFSTDFLDLNYWQAVIMLYRQSLSVPAALEGEYNTSEEVESPSAPTTELREDEERVFLKVAEAGQRVLRLYRSLHRMHLVNYTFLATHHLFMAGISFLYAIWHSPIVRSRLTMDEVDFTILAATSVLGDLIEKCPPAEACRDAFERMSKATVQMCMSTTGFSSSAQGLNASTRRKSDNRPSGDYFSSSSSSTTTPFATNSARSHKSSNHHHHHHRHSAERQQKAASRAQFDLGLNDLFGPSTPMPQPSRVPDMQAPGQFQRSQATNSSATVRGIKSEYSPGDAYAMPPSQSQRPSPSDYGQSPGQMPLDTSAIDPSLLPSPQAAPLPLQQPYISPDPNMNSAMYGSTHNNDSSATTNPANNHSNNNNNSGSSNTTNNTLQGLDFSLADMDFLQQGDVGLGLGAVGDGGGAGAAAGMHGGPSDPAGMDFGFGLGWDGMDHDFSEGNQLDLFDGFFFGGGPGGNP